ncbi:MAG: class I SAM-dependent methyltransferase, partial [Patescibacteria group bacterium]
GVEVLIHQISSHLNLNSSSLFQGAALYYARYRRQYSPKIFTDIVSFYGLNGKGRLLDLGCGTGELTLPLSPYFLDAVGVDPSADMLFQAKGRQKREKNSNIHWVQGRAEDIKKTIAPVRLVTSGASFHWMDQSVVLNKAYSVLENAGGMVIIADPSPVRGKDKKEDWKVKRQKIIEKYLGLDRRAGDYLHKNFIPEKRPFAELIKESPFRVFEFENYKYTTERSIDDIIGFLYSTSYASRRLFGDSVDDFEKEMRQELSGLVPKGIFIEEGNTEMFLLRK